MKQRGHVLHTASTDINISIPKAHNKSIALRIIAALREINTIYILGRVTWISITTNNTDNILNY